MKNLIAYLTMLMLLTSCGELSYKRGAGVADLEKDKSTCQTQSNDPYEKCLTEKGWSTQNLSELSLFETLSLKSATPTNLDKIEISASEVAAQTSVQAEKVDSVPITENVNIENSATKEKPQTAMQNTAQLNEKSTIKTPSPVAPTDIYVVNSWWKLGAKSDAFSTDSAACSVSLGNDHLPNHAQQTYTAAFLVCMRDKNWKALVKPS